MATGEESEICDLVIRVFDEFNRSEYSEEGIRGFYSYVSPFMLSKRTRLNHFVLTAKVDHQIAGIIEVCDFDHISLLFVDKPFQQRGIAGILMEKALRHCQQERQDKTSITVNASPYAVSIYKKLGFYITGTDRTQNGIFFTPMKLDFKKSGSSDQILT